jgi:hypothetical protein
VQEQEHRSSTDPYVANMQSLLLSHSPVLLLKEWMSQVASTGEALFPGYIGKFSRLHSNVSPIVAAPGLRPSDVRCRRTNREDLACA